MQALHVEKESLANRQLWQSWCRLCAKEANEHHVQLFCKNENNFLDPALITAIGRYFWVNLTPNDQLPDSLCVDCYELITGLIEFSERVNKVQSMYYALISAGQCNLQQALKVRAQHGVLTEQWQHIMRRRQHSETELSKWQQQENEPNDQHEETLELCVEMGEDVEEEEEEQEEEEVVDIKNEEIYEHVVKELAETAVNHGDREQKLEADQLSLIDEAVFDSDEDSSASVASKENKRSVEKCKITRKCKRARYTEKSEQEENVANGSASPQQQDLDVEEDEADIKLTSVFKYACNICSRKYKNPTSYRRHMLESHNCQPDIPDFKCDECGKILPTEKQLNLHVRTHLPLELKMDVPCPYCDKKFTKVTVMRQHINGQHYNQKPFVCDECGKALKTLAALNEHKLVHTNECPFECNVCHKKFKNKARLKVSKICITCN